jgi:hypothetical protein
MYCGVNASFASNLLLLIVILLNQEAGNAESVAAGVSPATKDKIDIAAHTASIDAGSAAIHFDTV